MIEFEDDYRLICLSEDIDNSSIGTAMACILKYIAEDDKKDRKIKDYKRKPIKIYISSNGGFVYDMWALIDIILTSKTPVYTYCTGYAMSAGLQIFLAGHKRYCSKHATFVYHQLSGGVVGTYQSMAENIDESKYQQNAIEEYVRSRTNITMKQLEEIRIKKQDVFIHPDEALDLGIVDEIIE